MTRSRLRATLGPLKRRLRYGRPATKQEAELWWWRTTWDPVIRAGGLWGPDTLELSGDPEVAPTYEGRRWQQARAEVRRVMREAGVDDPGFFAGKVVLDVGPGLVGFPDACPAAVSLAVEPLARSFAPHGLLLASRAVYLSVPAEDLPLVDESTDVVVSRNSLDHVEDPPLAVGEIGRVLRPGGAFILDVDIGQTPTLTEPQPLTLPLLRELLEASALHIVREDHWDHPHGGDGHAVVLVAEKRP